MSEYGNSRRNQMAYKMNIERRKKWLRRLWWNYSKEIGMVLWVTVAFMLSIGAWLVFLNGLQWLKGRIG